MMVWDVVQIVNVDHSTSYKVGQNWLESHDSEQEAASKAEQYNYHRGSQCVGVEYVVDGPFPEDMPRV